jgi:pSer/pThr/pTyr-binding forkhead associated (FHA) protein
MDVQMLVIQGRPRGKSLRFPPGEFIIGRGPECHVRPESPTVSRQHCLLRVAFDGVHIRDLGSTNGTLVNGTRVMQEQPLKDGDLLQLGPLVLQLRCAETADDEPGSAGAAEEARALARGCADTVEGSLFASKTDELSSLPGG